MKDRFMDMTYSHFNCFLDGTLREGRFEKVDFVSLEHKLIYFRVILFRSVHVCRKVKLKSQKLSPLLN